MSATIVVLGGGPAGYVAALRAAQLGARVTVVESREIGGTCLNRGCIPTKALVAAVQRLRLARGAGEFGIELGEPRVDFGALMARKSAVVAQQRGGVEHLLKGRKVDVVAGPGGCSTRTPCGSPPTAPSATSRPTPSSWPPARDPPCRPCSTSPTRG